MQQKHASKAILAVAYILSALLVISILILVVVYFSMHGKTSTDQQVTGPDYAVSRKIIWDKDAIPSADAFLSDNARHMVKSASYAVMPQKVLGDQTVAILMQMEDGTMRTENAVLSIREPVVRLELGDTAATPQSLLGDEYAGAAFSKPIEDFTQVGSYPIEVVTGTEKYPFTLIVQDTTAPVVELRSPAQFAVGQQVTPEDFVVKCTDAQAVTYKFNIPPVTAKEGTFTASILATDASGNSHTYEAVYTVGDASAVSTAATSSTDPAGSTTRTTQTTAADTGTGKAPVLSGVPAEMKTVIGRPVNYLRGVTAKDERGIEVKVTAAEPAGFNIDISGDYTITFTAADAAGRTASQTATLKVYGGLKEVDSFSEDDALRMGDVIIQELIPDDRLPEVKKARRIYRYVQDHMIYAENRDIKPWHEAAVVSVYKESGDCRNYFALAKLLLTCAGFENVDATRVLRKTGESHHYWNIVVIDGKWYHYDTTPRKGRSDLFMLTDAQLDAYNDSQSDKPYNRDKSLYPATAP